MGGLITTERERVCVHVRKIEKERHRDGRGVWERTERICRAAGLGIRRRMAALQTLSMRSKNQVKEERELDTLSGCDTQLN